MLESVDHLDRDKFDVAEMMNETVLDLDEIVQFLDEVRKFAYSAEKCHLFRNRKPLSHSANPTIQTMSWRPYWVNCALLLSS
jgi:hypothetical protein